MVGTIIHRRSKAECRNRQNSMMSNTVIQVFGHSRPRALRYVLEGLRRQGAMPITEVWLDGHEEKPELVPKVEECRALEKEFPAAKWMKYGSRVGHVKIFIDAMRTAIPKYENIIILEDDCFPGRDAISAFEDGLNRIRSDPTYFSIYGHHFGGPKEGDETTAFQCWGWATTSQKMKPILEDFVRLWEMPEPECVLWIKEHMTEDIRNRMDVFPGRSDTSILQTQFCFDAVIAFLVAKEKMLNKRTPQQVVFNFGIGEDSGHFTQEMPMFFVPPYNMISESELVRRFDLAPSKVRLGSLLKAISLK